MPRRSRFVIHGASRLHAAQAPDLKDNVVAKLADERNAAWQAVLPLGDDAALWDYLTLVNQGG